MFKFVSPGLFQTMGTRLIAGREYRWEDLYEKRQVAIVSENLARQMWGTAAAAVGKRIVVPVPKAPLREVIGVVQDVRDNNVQEPAPEIVYWPAFGESIYQQGPVTAWRTITIVIRSPQAGTEALLNQVRRAVWSVNANLPLASVRTMKETYNRSLARTSFTLVMLSIASVMALTLGIIGIYGVVAYAVSYRKREIAIRLALGAAPIELKRMFVSDGLKLVAIGVTCGLVGAALLSRVMSALLFDISPLDPGTYAVVAVMLIFTAAIASYVPARRAAAVEPMDALKAE